MNRSNAMAAYEKLSRLDAAFSGRLGVAAMELPDDPEPVLLHADEAFPTASVIKLPILVEFYRQVEAGLLAPEEHYTLRAEDAVPGSGVLKELQPGAELSWKDLAQLMIVVSDNSATNILIKQLGRENINTTCHRLGLDQTYLVGLLQVPPERQTEEQRAGRLSTTTPRDMLHLLRQIYLGTAASPSSCQKIIETLRHQQYTDIVGRYLPYDADAVEDGEPGTAIIASKSGAIRGVRNEIGFIWNPDQSVVYAFALLTRDCQDPRFWVDNEGALCVSRASQILYELYTGAASAAQFCSLP
ncbi:MAG: serine hydrolase [Limnochordaceae bacterium]|nr:serine hydrolase [Limnochordaceae bacterium]